MQKAAFYLAVVLATAVLSLSFIKKPSPAPASKTAKSTVITTGTVTSANRHDHAAEVSTLSTNLYTALNLEEKGLSKAALTVALKGYLTLKEEGALKNPDLLTIVDFSQSSRKRRFYLFDVKELKLLEQTFVAHAKNSGVDNAELFSNVIGSEKSSLGFYVTKGIYTGKHGLSLRLAGLEKSFNSNAEARAIVVHGADYVNAGRVQSAYMGRSQGCPAIPMENYIRIITKIKNGTALFIYSPNAFYLNNSALLA